ncbi:MFS transporter [Orrella sp. 11846]|uniref:MFS transporter n=1 Tax=Orrella sp. 11846 TaxID=3409913 RepID=UPI003B5A0536
MSAQEIATTPMNSETEFDSGLDSAVRWRVLFVLLVAMFMSLVGVSIVNVALPSIRLSLDTSHSEIQWVLSGYALTFGVVLVAAGRAGDILGRGGLFLIGVAIFTLSSVAAGLAPSGDWLIAARFLQGVGSGLLSPQGMGMIQQYFRGAERGKAFGYFGTTVGLSVAIGPVMGGLLIKLGGMDLGWRLTFLVNVPIGLMTFILGWRWFPRPLIRRTVAQRHFGAPWWYMLDPVGSLLLALAVLAILFPFVESGRSAWFWVLLFVGFYLVYAWVRWEQRYKRQGHSPMVDLSLFVTPSFRNGVVIMTLYFFGMTSIWVLVALYVQEGHGWSAFLSGLVGVPSALISAYSAHWAGDRVARMGRKIVIGGLAIALLGLAMTIAVVILNTTHGLSVWWLLLTLGVFGIGQGATISPNQALTLSEVPLEYAGSSGAILQTGQRMGTSVGIALITAAVFFSLSHYDWTVSMVVGLLIIATVITIALWVAVQDLKGREKTGLSNL